MNAKRIGFFTALTASLGFLCAGAVLGQSEDRGAYDRSAYTYIRDSAGEVTVVSGLNGTVTARRNMPISAGDEIRTDDAGRVEVALADGNVLHVGGGTDLKLSSLRDQQGSEDQVSAIELTEGSVVLAGVGSDDRSLPRIDTEDATIYVNSGGRVRVNADPRRGTVVVARAGSAEVRTRAGSYTVRAGNYLIAHGDQEPEVARGDFSRDRFDIWAADRLETTYESNRSASSRYVGEDYSSDVQSLDGYGDWDYNSNYSSYVWRPRVAVDWTPYSYGSWYYTPIGLNWWSWDPWGWVPFHYGNWFFDAGWNSWCWAPGSVFSPAWVNWGFSGGFVGWCPFGWNSPWWNPFFPRFDGFNRVNVNVFVNINGVFSTRRVDFRGWNFTNASNFGAVNTRMQVIPGTRVVDRLGSQVAISSRPVVVNARGNVRESLRNFVREAPRTIQRTAGPDSARLEPVLAHDKTLPRETIDALRQRTVVAERGRLSGPGANEIAPRGATVVERSPRIATDRSTGRTVITDRAPATALPDRGRTIDQTPRDRGAESRTQARESWRGRTMGPVTRDREGLSREPNSGRDNGRAPSSQPQPRIDRAPAPSQQWRGRERSDGGITRSAPRPNEPARRAESWRSRPSSEVPPARRVIEGAIPGRRPAESGPTWRDRERAPMSRDLAPRELSPRERRFERAPRQAPAPREFSPREREFSPRQRDFAPRERRFEPAPRREAPAPREFAPAPRSRDFAPAPRSMAPPPARVAPPSSHSSPPSRAPAPSHGSSPGSNRHGLP